MGVGTGHLGLDPHEDLEDVAAEKRYLVTKKLLVTVITACSLISCNPMKEQPNPFTNVEEARNHVTQSFSKPEEQLLIADEMNDPMGLNMTIIGDAILKKGYMPKGFEQKNGYRIYFYKKE